ncbi:RICIN domain-containing protein [Streptomyces sp. NPDC020681]|uniref:RICIN domain-containing protein n=1 Tax=Streptomyces sp. NPDC020681 TaxID=3365083 RepID=UPI003793ECB8
MPLLVGALSDDDEKKPKAGGSELSGGSMTLEEPPGMQGSAGGGGYTMESDAPAEPSMEAPTPKDKQQKDPKGGTTSGGNDNGSDPEHRNAPPSAGMVVGTDARKTVEAQTQTQERQKAVPATVVNVANSKRVLLKNKMTGLCADILGTGKGRLQGPAVQYKCNNESNDNQLWDFTVRYEKKGPGKADLFTISNIKDGFCLDVTGTSTAPKNSQVFENKCSPTTSDNQLWYLESRGNNDWWIRNYTAGGQCLNIAGWAGEGGRGWKVEIRPCLVNDDHKWYITK